MFIREGGRVPTQKLAHLSAHSQEIAFCKRIFVAFNKILKQSVTFLITFSIPRYISVVISRKLKFKNLGRKCKKVRGTPSFFSISSSKLFVRFFKILRLEFIEGY